MKINAVYKISETPLIYASTGPKYWDKIPYAENGGYLLCHPMWQFSWTSLRLYHQMRHLLKQKNIKLILLHNSKEEYRFARLFGFRSKFINQNIHACEHNFTITPQTKTYDAVYIAAAKPYKRIHLAKAIKNLFIVTYFWPLVQDDDGNWDLHAVEPEVKHAEFNRQWFSPEQIKDILNRSYCGLALSKKEGAMWAIMEYLLSGLPVVSTPSKGGRTFFFDDRYTRVVPDNPEAIREAVEALKNASLDPKWIREETLKKMEVTRRDYYELCQSLVGSKGELGDYDTFYGHVWGGEGIHKLRII